MQCLFSYYDPAMQRFSLGKYTGKEEVYVDTVRLCGEFDTSAKKGAKASILFRLTVRYSLFVLLS